MRNKITLGGGKESGAAMIEAAACLGLLVFLIQGIAFVCFSLSNLISVAQMAYSSAMAGIEVPPGQSSSLVMGGRANSMLWASKGHFQGQNESHPFGDNAFAGKPGDADNHLVTVSLSPKLISAATGPFAAIIGATITAPSIYPSHQIAEDLQQPANPVGRVYDCDGKITQSAPSHCSTSTGSGGGGHGGCHSFCFIDAQQE